DLRDLPSFPTRRSSDLLRGGTKWLRLFVYSTTTPYWVTRNPMPAMTFRAWNVILAARPCRAPRKSISSQGSYWAVFPVNSGCVRSEEHTSELQSRGHLV